MPRTKDLSVRVLVGGVELPEYTVDGSTYIECILTSQVSYKQMQADFVGGELEKQEWPVTPYRIEITSKSLKDPKYFRVLVDGVKVKAVSLNPNEKKIIKGFRDGSVIREFLFSMPRFAKDLTDRIDDSRESSVGTIEVQCWDAELKTSNWLVREKQVEFIQANKKDCQHVTKGDYTMATSKVGKAIAKRSVLRKVDSWNRIRLRNSVKLHYRMGHTLQEMGITLKPLPATPRADARKTEVKSEAKMEGRTIEWDNEVIEIDDDEDDAVASGSGLDARQPRRAAGVTVISESDDSSDSERRTGSGRKRRVSRRSAVKKRLKTTDDGKKKDTDSDDHATVTQTATSEHADMPVHVIAASVDDQVISSTVRPEEHGVNAKSPIATNDNDNNAKEAASQNDDEHLPDTSNDTENNTNKFLMESSPRQYVDSDHDIPLTGEVSISNMNDSDQDFDEDVNDQNEENLLAPENATIGNTTVTDREISEKITDPTPSPNEDVNDQNEENLVAPENATIGNTTITDREISEKIDDPTPSPKRTDDLEISATPVSTKNNDAEHADIEQSSSNAADDLEPSTTQKSPESNTTESGNNDSKDSQVVDPEGGQSQSDQGQGDECPGSP